MEAPDARECVGDHLRLDPQLALVGDVGVQASAAQRIGVRLAAIRRRLVDAYRVGKRHALADTLDARRHTLAGHGAADEHDLPVHASDHPSADSGLFDQQRERCSRLKHVRTPPAGLYSNATIGRRKHSRTSRTNAASVTWAKASGAIR